MSDKTQSKYAKKCEEKTRMYGPGCCGHKLTRERMNSIREQNGTRVQDRDGRFHNVPGLPSSPYYYAEQV